MALATKGDVGARERLHRHDQETRDLTTTATAGGGFVPPSVPRRAVRGPPASRPFADVLPSRPLPNAGMTITIPRSRPGTGGRGDDVGERVGQRSRPRRGDDHVPVRTIAGQQDVSQQLLDRSDPSIDSIIFGDLRSSYDQQLDTGCCQAPVVRAGARDPGGLVGQHRLLHGRVTDRGGACCRRSTTRSRRSRRPGTQPAGHDRHAPAQGCVARVEPELDVPAVPAGQPVQAAGTQDNGMLSTFAASASSSTRRSAPLYGAGTNEDEIYVLRAADLILMEGRCSRTGPSEVLSGTLTVRMQLFGYVAFASATVPVRDHRDRFPRSRYQFANAITAIASSYRLAEPTASVGQRVSRRRSTGSAGRESSGRVLSAAQTSLRRGGTASFARTLAPCVRVAGSVLNSRDDRSSRSCTESLSRNTTPCSNRKAGFARSARRPKSGGLVSTSRSTTAIQTVKCVASCAATATEAWGRSGMTPDSSKPQSVI
jgi:hypothetical protein